VSLVWPKKEILRKLQPYPQKPKPPSARHPPTTTGHSDRCTHYADVFFQRYYQQSFRPEQAEAFSARSSANESACAVEESLVDPSRKPSPLFDTPSRNSSSTESYSAKPALQPFPRAHNLRALLTRRRIPFRHQRSRQIHPRKVHPSQIRLPQNRHAHIRTRKLRTADIRQPKIRIP